MSVDDLDLRPVCPLCGQRVEALVPFGQGRVCQPCAQKHPVPPKSDLYDGIDFEKEGGT